jgi:L-amino acid N-acyltransferase YncA
MTLTYVWYESYESVVLETDWTKMQERIEWAESKINDRKRVLSEDHDGTPEERQAIANALNALGTLRTEVADWQSRQAWQAERRRDHV